MGKIYEALEWSRKESQQTEPTNNKTDVFSIARFKPQKLRIGPAAIPHFEQLKANFLSRYGGGMVRTVMFAGIEPHDGASSSAVYFSCLLAKEARHKVLLLDSDLKKPNFKRYFNTKNCYSLQWLAGAGGADKVSQFLPPNVEAGNLYVIPSNGAAHVAENSSGFFQSANFRRFLGDMRERFDYTIIDGPALRKNPESILLSGMVDGVVLVVRAGETPRWLISTMQRQIEDAGGNVLGVVLNRRQHHIPNWLYRLL